MISDYQIGYQIRQMRFWGLILTLIMLLIGAMALGLHIVATSELRSMDITRQRLASSLSSLAAEQMAKQQIPNAVWSKLNPFVLLRWQQDDYCGELAAGDEPQAGCWYWLPTLAWVLYRSGWAGGCIMHAWRVSASALPSGVPTVSQQMSRVFTLELAAVPTAELVIQGFK